MCGWVGEAWDDVMFLSEICSHWGWVHQRSTAFGMLHWRSALAVLVQLGASS